MRQQGRSPGARLEAFPVGGDVMVTFDGGSEILMTPHAVLAGMESLWRAASTALLTERESLAPSPSGRPLWRGRQWAVTDEGLATVDPAPPVLIQAQRLGDPWTQAGASLAEAPIDIAAEVWLDADDYLTAYLVALALHAESYPALDRGRVLEDLRKATEVAAHVQGPEDDEPSSSVVRLRPGRSSASSD